jgi:hypothetical protein
MGKIPIIIFLVLMVVAPAKLHATMVDSNSIVQDGIEYYIQTDKSIYNLGENVEMMFRVTNFRNEEWIFGYMPPVLDIIVATKEAESFNTIWFWSWSGIWPAGPKVYRLKSGEFVELNGIWPQIGLNGTCEIEDDTQVSPGTYGIGGRIGRSAFDDTVSNSHVTLEITIIPELGSLAFLGMGLAGLLIHNKKKKIRYI